MSAQDTSLNHYDTVHRFARHHKTISRFLQAARPNQFNLPDFVSVQTEARDFTSSAGATQSAHTMASMQSQEELANMQKLSNEYQPDVEVNSPQSSLEV